METRRMHTEFRWDSQKEKATRKTSLVGRIVLQWISEKYEGILWSGIIWPRTWAVKGSCEPSNETSGSIKYLEILEELINW
jgi:hypothetical protein